MKTIGCSLGFILISVGLWAQGSGAYVNVTFTSLKDLMAREPAFTIPQAFHFERQKHRGKVNGQKVAAYRIQGPKKRKLPRTNVFAILMDGALYVNPDRPRLTRRADFYQVEWIGTYGYFIDMQDYPVWVDDVYMEQTNLKEKLIDTSTGKIVDLNKKILRKILQDQPELLVAFEAEGRKGRKLKEYLIRAQRQRSSLYLDYFI